MATQDIKTLERYSPNYQIESIPVTALCGETRWFRNASPRDLSREMARVIKVDHHAPSENEPIAPSIVLGADDVASRIVCIAKPCDAVNTGNLKMLGVLNTTFSNEFVETMKIGEVCELILAFPDSDFSFGHVLACGDRVAMNTVYWSGQSGAGGASMFSGWYGGGHELTAAIGVQFASCSVTKIGLKLTLIRVNNESNLMNLMII